MKHWKINEMISGAPYLSKITNQILELNPTHYIKPLSFYAIGIFILIFVLLLCIYLVWRRGQQWSREHASGASVFALQLCQMKEKRGRCGRCRREASKGKTSKGKGWRRCKALGHVYTAELSWVPKERLEPLTLSRAGSSFTPDPS